MSDWTVTDRPIKTPYGVIHYGNGCRDDYPNMVTVDMLPEEGGNLLITLQRPAMKALLAAQVRYAKRMGWSKQRIEKRTVKIGAKKYPIGRPIVMLPGTNRTCEIQTKLYNSDHNRYAAPQITGHTRGLAVDRSNAQPNLSIVDACLAAEGWTRVRPTDEPWHWSAPGVTI